MTRHGDRVEVRLEDGVVVIRPMTSRRVELKGLLRKVNRNNVHHEIQTGRGVGREVW